MDYSFRKFCSIDEQIALNDMATVCSVVVAPTKELAQQILAVCSELCEGTGLRCHSLGKGLVNLDNMVKLRVGAANSATDTVQQTLTYCGSEPGKLLAWRAIVQGDISPPTLVFVQTKVGVTHSGRSEQQRENTVRAFRAGGIWVLICTELLGRGIDFKGVSLVVNYDFPPSAVSYIHRIGRTGRAGRAEPRTALHNLESLQQRLRHHRSWPRH